MLKSLAAAAGACMLLAFAPALATETTPPATQTAAASDADEIICKRQEETGTRLRKQKICKTKAEWKAEADAAKEMAKGIERRGAAQPGGDNLIGR